MRIVLCLALLALAAACGPVRPMTESEFKGFCYQYDAGPQTDCVPINTCDAYLTVIGVPQPSQQACLDGCKGVYAEQVQRMGLTGCKGAPEFARDWCQRYCRNAYPQ
ncbi:hypothetical protein NNJEOMEG_01565 [Fundidesulfovibrio magnetotacticus]|uniref:Lipoprotein n=1 Tax=Fundidesulfovibrio magnetotacticus TaxID=2730080 RepID=A0A6V8LT30_9BACT|nr:hypothetical protein [Fundidesulfovibrio magnetotacticus]GFK93731.1 hypothetical protein NNJEOMEG_01565 [Fundidesulfovibrio magnetotacticus]